MASVNKVILVGNLGADPEVRYMSNGEAVANVRLATTESWKDKNSGEKREVTEWHRVVFYRKLAEIVGQYLKKGSSVYVEGRLQTRKYTDKDGVERYATDIIAESMQMLGNAGNGNAGHHAVEDSGHDEPAAAPAAAPAPAPAAAQAGKRGGGKPAAKGARPAPAPVPHDNDIPF